MVAKGHKITNVPLFKNICDMIVFFVTIIFEQKNCYVPHFLKHRDINSYYILVINCIFLESLFLKGLFLDSLFLNGLFLDKLVFNGIH